ncbi:nuclear transport factor 2 family protein [Flavobacteriaceae bacterium R33]|uniref:Nuclear transport factor 2 family protein n=2 Tax=Poritiphilus flavus TaxID=2697053 RepID=A0A6L9EH61_9FLAO|nr:nuclear transport factor 2 family protein [Poritiphilus flavus]
MDLTNPDTLAEVISEDMLWHYFNPELPELHGDYRGLKGFKDFFMKMGALTQGKFKVNVQSAHAFGDELVVTHSKNSMLLDMREMVVDAVVVWRILNDKIVEGWDIPSVNTVKVKG